MKVLIDISQEMFEATQKYYSDNTTRLSIKSCIEKIANGTPIPDNATNGDMIKAMFPNISVYEHGSTYSVNNEYNFNSTWWDTPYKGGNLDGSN